MVKLSDPAIKIAQEAHVKAFRDLYIGHPGESVLSIANIPQREYLRPDEESFAEWLKAMIRSFEENASLGADTITFSPLVAEFWPLGVHFVDALFGAHVSERDGNFWADQLPTELGSLKPVDVEHAELVLWSLEAMSRALSSLPKGISLTTPVFASPLNIALNLFGERALMALSLVETADMAGLAVIADTIEALHRLIRKRFPQKRVRFYASSHRYAPDGFGHICGCSTQLVGPQAYAEHVAPLDAQVLRVYPEGGTIHLCGYHTQHIPCWRKMENLRGVQLNDAAADDFEHYFRGLRDDQMIYVALTRSMTVERILKISGGRRVILQTRLEKKLEARPPR